MDAPTTTYNSTESTLITPVLLQKKSARRQASESNAPISSLQFPWPSVRGTRLLPNNPSYASADTLLTSNNSEADVEPRQVVPEGAEEHPRGHCTNAEDAESTVAVIAAETGGQRTC